MFGASVFILLVLLAILSLCRAFLWSRRIRKTELPSTFYIFTILWILCAAVALVAATGVWRIAGADGRQRPPKVSVQEPTDWTQLNDPRNGTEAFVRTLVVDGHKST